MTDNSPNDTGANGGPENDSPENDSPEPLLKEKRKRIGILVRIRNYFFAGLLVTAPAFITVYLAWWFIDFVDNKVTPLIPAKYNPEQYLPVGIPGLGLVILFVFLTLVGALAAGFVGRYVVRIGENILHRMPVIRSVYAMVKQVFEMVLKGKSEAFRQVVLVEYPRRGIWAIGFVSGTTEGEVQNLTSDEMINVFLPTTPNPTSGFLLFLPRQDLTVLHMSVEEGIKMVVSGGLVTPNDPRTAAEKKKHTIPTS